MPAVELEGRLPAHKQTHPELANAGYTMPRQSREFGKSGKQRVHIPCNISMMQLTARSESRVNPAYRAIGEGTYPTLD
jgi:hypothetical protein